MAKEKTPKDEGSLIPIIAASLLANAFERSGNPDLVSSGGDVRRIGRENKYTWSMFEGALLAFIERSSMSSGSKMLATKLADSIFDKIKRMPADAPYPMQLRGIEEAGRSLIALVAGGKKDVKPSDLPKFEAGLSKPLQDELLRMSLFLSTWDSASYGTFMEALARIDTKERLERMLNLYASASDNLPPPPPAPKDGTARTGYSDADWRTYQKRIRFLQASMAKQEGWKDVILAGLRGEGTPQGRALEASIRKFAKDADDFGDNQTEVANDIRSENGIATADKNGWQTWISFGICVIACIGLFAYVLYALWS